MVAYLIAETAFLIAIVSAAQRRSRLTSAYTPAIAPPGILGTGGKMTKTLLEERAKDREREDR